MLRPGRLQATSAAVVLSRRTSPLISRSPERSQATAAPCVPPAHALASSAPPAGRLKRRARLVEPYGADSDTNRAP